VSTAGCPLASDDVTAIHTGMDHTPFWYFAIKSYRIRSNCGFTLYFNHADPAVGRQLVRQAPTQRGSYSIIVEARMHRWFGKRGKLVRGLIIALALLLILLEWIIRLLAGVVHSLIALLGLTRFEMWMRSLPLWCVFPITVTVAAGYGLLEFTQFALLARRQYMLAGWAHILKWLIFPVLSYIWRLYDERLLRYAWIRSIYGFYMFAHELIVGWVHKQEWYGRALEIKNRCVEGTRHRLVLAREAVRRWRVALHHRNTIFNIARRLKSIRFRRSS
jgi:hypothetical protein